MLRSVSAVLAIWVVASSPIPAQTQQTGPGAGGKVKTSSPYHPAGSMVEWSGEASDMPPDMPNVIVPRLTPARPVSIQGGQPPALAPPPAAPLPTVTTPAALPQGSPAATIGNSGGSWNHSSSPTLAPSSHQPCGQACNSCNGGDCDSCAPCSACGPEGRVWLGAEYLFWTSRGMGLPALVTRSPLGTPRANAGVLGDPGTTVVYGGQNVNDAFRSGIRLYSGMWLDECQLFGIESSTFYLQPTGDGASFDCFNNTMIFARPYQNIDPRVNRPDSQLVCYPNLVAGEVAVNARTKFWGTDAFARANLFCGCNYRLDLLGGYRYLQLQDTATIRENLVVVDPAGGFPVGTNVQVYDSFYSNNVFNGGALGAAGEVRSGRMFATARSTIAFGSTYKQIEIAGATQIAVPGGLPTTTLGGLLTQPTNIGTFSSTAFAVVPEATVAVGYQVSDMIRAYVGYTFIYLSNVARAGDQIDRTVNGSQVGGGQFVGAPRPIFVRNDTDFWAQGITFGAEIRY